MRQLALLRGINVGGNAPIRMDALRACIGELGVTGVSTYIASGNVLFESDEDGAALEPRIEGAIETAFAVPVKVVVRSRPELDTIVQAVPPHWIGNAELRSRVIFLRRSIDRPEVLDGLTTRPEIDELRYAPGAILWAAPQAQLTRSRMVDLVRSPLYPELTMRSLGTALKLHELL